MKKWVVLVALAALAGCGGAGPKVWRIVAKQADFHFVEIDERFAGDADAIGRAAADVCKDEPFCAVGVWSSKDVVPSSLPLSDEALASQLASYRQNTAIGVKKLMLKCGRFAGQDENTCFSE